MTCIMDPVYQLRPQPMWGPQPAAIPAALDMEYYIPHPPFTSPPPTPMTPVTPHPHIFNPPHYEQAIPAPPPNPYPPAPQQTYPPLEYRLYALCQQLLSYSQVPDTHHKVFWEQFMVEYFTENATLTVGGDFGEGQRKYCLSQQWIQWYFKSMLENGVIGMCLRLPCFTTTFTQSGHHLECSDAIMETDINMPTHDIVKVCTTGSLAVEFSLEEKPRIVSWFFLIREHQEFVPRNSLAGVVDDKLLTMNITNHGLLPAVHELLSRAGMMEAGLPDSVQLPACSATPTSASLTSPWPDQMTALNPQMTVTLQTLQTTANPPPPLHPLPLPACSVTLAPQDKGKAPQPSPLSSSKKMKPPQHSPASRSQFVMVAAEATTLLQAAEDLVPGLDERTITRVDNCRPVDHSPIHYNGSSDTSSAATPTAPPTFSQDPSFLSATLSQVPTLSWHTTEHSLSLSTQGQTLASAK